MPEGHIVRSILFMLIECKMLFVTTSRLAEHAVYLLHPSVAALKKVPHRNAGNARFRAGAENGSVHRLPDL